MFTFNINLRRYTLAVMQLPDVGAALAIGTTVGPDR